MMRDFTHRYGVGDILALAQSYNDVINHLFLKGHPHDAFLYRMGLVNRIGQHVNEVIANSEGFTNSLLVRADLMPYRVCITDVRTERLHDITERDLFAEGVQCQMDAEHQTLRYTFGDGKTYPTARETFVALIDYLFGRDVWNENPKTFVYTFHVISLVS